MATAEQAKPIASVAAVAAPAVIACLHCDLLQLEVPLAPRAIARCPRCGAELYRRRTASIDRSLALGLTCSPVFLIANTFPLMSMSVQGDTHSTSLPLATWALYEHHMVPLALLVFSTTILVPAMEIVAIVYLLLSLRLGFARAHFATIFRFVQAIRNWGMIDVLMLAVLVSVVKLGSLAQVVPGIALWAFCALITLLVALSASFNARDVWRWHREHHGIAQ